MATESSRLAALEYSASFSSQDKNGILSCHLVDEITYREYLSHHLECVTSQTIQNTQIVSGTQGSTIIKCQGHGP